MKQLAIYVTSFNSVGNQRIAVIIFCSVISLILVIIQSELGKNIPFSFLIATTGIIFSIASHQLLSELYLIHDSKYRILMELSENSEEINPFKEEWTILSEQGKLNSPVAYSSFEKYQVYIFLSLQILSFIINYLE